MDIKLKKLSEKQEKRLLWAAGMLAPVALALALMHWNYSTVAKVHWSTIQIQWLSYAAFGETVFAFVAGIWAVIKGNAYRKQEMAKEKLKPCKGDKIPVEFYAAGALFGGWMTVMTSADVSGKDLYALGCVVDNPYSIFLFASKCFLFLFLLYGCLLFLYRRLVFGMFKDTSYIYKRIRLYREKTPLEEQIHKHQKAGFVLAVTVQSVLSLVFLVNFLQYGDTEFLPIGAGLLLVDIILLRLWFSNPLAHDTGLLVQQIQAMSEGESIPEGLRLTEKSFLYETDQNLAHVEEAMKKSVEKQMQAERLKVDLITNMSHDLKTPLTSMVGYTDLLKKEELSDAARDYVDVISMKQEQLKNMIQDLFDLSKATSNVEQLTMEVLDMRKLLEQTLGDMEDQIKASENVIRTNFSQEPLLFLGDNSKMYRVVQNLLENALKYSLADTRIYVEAQKSGNKIRACIKNIASYEMDFAPEEIMERFVRGDKARTTQGHGLGLAISSSYVRNMAGSLEIELDGDLFKVKLEFPYVEKPQKTEA